MLLRSLVDPVPVVVERCEGVSPFVFVCEHAGLAVPRALGNLGLADDVWTQHIASDLGAKQVARCLARDLGSTLIYQQYSRLVIDCNRTHIADSLIPKVIHGTKVSGNNELDPTERMARLDEIHAPFHKEIEQELEIRRIQNTPTILASIHSFTPKLGNEERPWHIGVQYAQNSVFADIVMNILREDVKLCIGDNQPWPVNETDDYTIPMHGDGRNLPYVMIEIRQDLIATEGAQKSWAKKLAIVFERASKEYYSHA
ncbi:MAG: N-formylglutamate amidohydrolase [Robiginitomaculum sp.]|nr:MAG: N-formylglutamate amidohydrolase [Robiginitomaculum sp.]